jgi:hypothetical protein
MRFKISGVYGEKFAPNGSMIRLPSSFNMYLKSESGVTRFIEDMKPFRSITVYDVVEGRDRSQEFLNLE